MPNLLLHSRKLSRSLSQGICICVCKAESPFIWCPKCVPRSKEGQQGRKDACVKATDQSTSRKTANMIKHQLALVSAVAPGLRLLHLLLVCDSGSSRSVSTISPPPPSASSSSLQPTSLLFPQVLTLPQVFTFHSYLHNVVFLLLPSSDVPQWMDPFHLLSAFQFSLPRLDQT